MTDKTPDPDSSTEYTLPRELVIQSQVYIDGRFYGSGDLIVDYAQDCGFNKGAKTQEDCIQLTNNTRVIADGISTGDGAFASRKSAEILTERLNNQPNLLLGTLLILREIREQVQKHMHMNGLTETPASTVTGYRIIEDESGRKFIEGISIGDSSIRVVRGLNVLPVNYMHDFYSLYTQLTLNRINNNGVGRNGGIITSTGLQIIHNTVMNLKNTAKTDSIKNTLMRIYPSNHSVCSLVSSNLRNIGLSDHPTDLQNGFISTDRVLDAIAMDTIDDDPNVSDIVDFIKRYIIFRFEVFPGDRIILATDGIDDLNDYSIAAPAKMLNPDKNLAAYLVAAQLDYKGKSGSTYQDNSSVVTQKI